jgi:precorrin-6A/cobalt-precorrin-6A reductase
MPDRERHLLILGGTAEAAQLATAIWRRFGGRIAVTTSLAGRTRAPTAVAGTMRVGGFGGAAGLARWLATARVDMVVDATHPFAARISANARRACVAAAVPRLILARRPWAAKPGDDWRRVADLDGAAAVLPDFAKRVFLSVGAQGLQAFAGLGGVHLVVRTIDPPAAALPLDDYRLVLGRGPFDEESELRLLQGERIDALVSRNSGGTATYAKIGAALRLGLPVVMVAPPPREAGTHVDALEGALQWIAKRVTA